MSASDVDTAFLLEARYHQAGRRDEFVVVGYIACAGPRVTLFEALGESGRPSKILLSNLKYLVLMSAPRHYESLRSLASPFWSFVDVATRLTHSVRANDN